MNEKIEKMNDSQDEFDLTKIEEMRQYLREKDHIIEVEIPDRLLIDLIEKMVGTRFWTIVTQNIYKFLKEHYEEIKVSRILTEEEEHLLDLIDTYYKNIIDGYELVIEEERKKNKEVKQ